MFQKRDYLKTEIKEENKFTESQITTSQNLNDRVEIEESENHIDQDVKQILHNLFNNIKNIETKIV